MTDKFVTILTSVYPTDLLIIRGRLEAEGIDCFVQDELTAQINSFYSQAAGGAKLQVKESDLKEAIDILKQNGYLQAEDLQPSRLFLSIDKFTSRLPLVGKLNLGVRLAVITIVLILVIAFILYFAVSSSVNI